MAYKIMEYPPEMEALRKEIMKMASQERPFSQTLTKILFQLNVFRFRHQGGGNGSFQLCKVVRIELLAHFYPLISERLKGQEEVYQFAIIFTSNWVISPEHQYFFLFGNAGCAKVNVRTNTGKYVDICCALKALNDMLENIRRKYPFVAV